MQEKEIKLADKNLQKKIENAYDPKGNLLKHINLKEKESEIRNNAKQKHSVDMQPHFNNIQFEPPQNLENKQNEIKFKQNAARISPKNIVQKLEQKAEAKNEGLKIAANKAVLKPSPRVEMKQKVIKPGVQAPYFMPPQRPTDIKPIKKEPDSVKVTDEVKQVQDLPDYPKNKKPSISIFKSVLKKFEVKKFERLVKPILDDLPVVVDPFTETIDWNFTQTGFPIPVVMYDKVDPQEFKINYTARNGTEVNIDDDDDDELYEVSDSDNEEETSANNEFNEDEDEDEEENGKNIQEQLDKAKKELFEAEKLIEFRKKEIVDRVGLKNFNEMYEFFKENANVIYI